MNLLALEKLKTVLRYDRESGLFIWLISFRGRMKAGDVAGKVASGGYIQVRFHGKDYLAHRLAWFFEHGALPVGPLDHINRKPSDNRILNLRECTATQNARNRSIQKNNRSGFTGVSWNKREEKWRAQIWLAPKRKTLGQFDCPVEASKAYQIAKEARDASF